MILLGIGANLPTEKYGDALSGCMAALRMLEASGVQVLASSRWYRSAPVPVSDQPWFVNGVVSVRTDFLPETLLTILHSVENNFGRMRGAPNAARVMDIDILAYGDMVAGWEAGSTWAGDIIIPHPRMHERGFVLYPLAEIAPDWRHPVLDRTAEELIRDLPGGQMVEIIVSAP
ncbi:MAG: 2-amino-4-hydroxy-6-hydroxymethyldihydropteridine diphosphokinase [Rhodospirillales bacterium]|nr:2-amino-4-hydroxy-6-hydroxymethyldihydropteridine diphosphokinase [Rhodospirillales bacterium]MCW8862739.1 2-amino-4-hydroxy-6-hydroxymethyldihydropteridine diphosphokinase [Rhodospirillales bacterium]MCW9002122.1 2-amino-4-hydroxy-6-hydroxymethyldihydropteridine diphosphokinase [Rhodospirillales bacterium]